MSVRVAIVNDMLIAVEALRRSLAGAPGITIAWTARDGEEAVTKCAQDTPDVVLMDLIMPRMDGVEATRRIMQATPCAILVVTATVDGNAAKVFDAMGAGALDAVNTPRLGPSGNPEGALELLAKLRTLSHLIGKPAPAAPRAQPPTPVVPGARPPFVAIGSSTGGPQALARVLLGLGQDFPAAIVIIQHVNAQFAAGLADWLSGQAPIPVRVATDGARPQPGLALLAATDDHLVLTPDLALRYTPDPKECPYRPSADAFFHSLARHWPDLGAAALLTGMGRDGATGLLALRQKGWTTLAQDEATSVVYGMPRAAAELGAATDILPLDQIGPALARIITRRRPPV